MLLFQAVLEKFQRKVLDKNIEKMPDKAAERDLLKILWKNLIILEKSKL